MAIDEQLVQKDRRLQALSLLSSFVRLQPAHLHLVLETQVIQHLHNCLLIDTGGTVVDLALTNLIMFLPHITSSLAACLPKLFVIYARILCWDQYAGKPESQSEKDNQSEKSSDGEINSALEFDASWEVVERSFESLQVMTPKANYLCSYSFLGSYSIVLIIQNSYLPLWFISSQLHGLHSQTKAVSQDEKLPRSRRSSLVPRHDSQTV